MLRSTFINDFTEALAYRLDEPTHRAVAELLAVYNPLTGPVRKVATSYGAAGSFPVHVGHTEYYDLDHVLQRLLGRSSLRTGVRQSLYAGGKGWSLHDMLVSSLAETVERLLGSLHYVLMGRDYLFGTCRELARQGVRCLSPDELPLFAEEQYADPEFRYEPFTDSTPLAWLIGKRLSSGEDVAVPAQFVEMFYPPDPAEALIGYSASGGLSSHVDRTRALFHGTVEVIERDHMNVHWYSRIPARRIVIDREPDSPALRRLLDEVRSLPGDVGLYYHCIDIPEVPVVTAVQIVPWANRDAYYAGGGADTDIESALVKALTEFTQSERVAKLAQLGPERNFAESARRIFELDPDAPASKIDRFLQVVSYYGYRSNIAKMRWYLDSGDEVRLSDLPRSPHTSMGEKLRALTDVLRRRKIDPIVFDFTPPQMNHVKVMKVFIAELSQPFVQSKPYLGHPRFALAPVWTGRRDTPLRYNELNTDPLPYP